MLDDYEDIKARYKLFDGFAIKDQKVYYQRTMENNRKSAIQVNLLRAGFALFSGISAAVAGLVVQTGNVSPQSFVVQFLAVMAVVLPAVGAVFNMLADLYQWDKLSSIYGAALDNLEVADALSPSPRLTDVDTYHTRVHAFAEGALSVMNDETAQWGQSIRTPKQVQKFVEQEQERASRIGRRLSPGSRNLDEDEDTPPTGE